jgi:hypothetical protein
MPEAATFVALCLKIFLMLPILANVFDVRQITASRNLGNSLSEY